MVALEEFVEIDDRRSEEDEREPEPHRYTITSYGADYPVDSLVKRLRDGSIYVPPFQRGFVWDIKEASRFVESLLLGLPVPSIFLSKEPDSGKLLVVDGQQRLSSLRYFYDGIWEPSKIEFSLKGVDKSFEGKAYRDLPDADRRRLDDAILHATIFRQEEPSDDESGIYQVFERLNSGGKKLTGQEIRSAVFHSGPLRQLLEDLNADENWRAIYGRPDRRMRDQELILRFLAFYHDAANYESPLVFFLNRFMKARRNMNERSASELRRLFTATIATAHRNLGPTPFRLSKILNAAAFDSVMVGIAKRLAAGPLVDERGFRAAYQQLTANPRFVEICAQGTGTEDRVKERLSLAESAFALVP